MNPSEKKDGFYAFGLFLIWPFLAAVAALKNFRSSWAKNIFWVFCAFYGFTFVVDLNSARDISSYVTEYQRLNSVNISFLEYLEIDEPKDYAIPFISLVLSRFTDSQPVLTLVYGILFGFFLSRNMWYIMERLEGKLLPVTILLLSCLFLINPIWNLNGIRMWLAAHIFLYGLLPYLCEGKKGGLLISCASVLVHFSFVLPLSVLFVYMLAGNMLTLYYAFFISTFFISEINLTVFNDFMELYAPESVQENTASYRGEQYVENVRTSVSENRWYAIWNTVALKWSVMGFLTLFYFRSREMFEENRYWLNLFCFVLLFYGVANLFTSLPSGARFLRVANFSAVALIVFYLQNQTQEKMMRIYTWIVSPALLLYMIVEIRIGFLSTGATSILGNPLIALFSAGQDMSLEQFLRMIF